MYDQNVSSQLYENCVRLLKSSPLNFSENYLKEFFKNVMLAESYSVESDAVPINIFKRDYSNLKHLNKYNGLAI